MAWLDVPTDQPAATPPGGGWVDSPEQPQHTPQQTAERGVDFGTALTYGLAHTVPFAEHIGAAAETYLPRSLSGAPPEATADYGQNLARIQRTSRAAEEKYPITSTVAPLAGAALTLPVAGPTEALSGAIAKAAPSAARLAPYLGAAGVGGGYGALYGSQSGAKGALTGAGLGAVGGAAAEPLAAFAGKIGRGISQFTGRYDPEAEASSRLAQAFQKDQRAGNAALTPSQFGEAQSAGQPVMAGDLGGEAVKRLGRAAVNISPEAGAALAQPLGQRFQQQGSRVSNYIDTLFPGKSLNTAIERDRIATEARATNTPAYQAAFNDPNAGSVWSPKLASLMTSDEVQSAVGLAQKKARADAALTGNPPVQNPFVKGQDGMWQLRVGPGGAAQTATPSLRWWDYVKRGLDSQTGVAKGAKDADSERVLTALNTALRGELDAQVPSYAQARAGAAKFFGQENAVDGAEAFYRTAGQGPVNQAISQIRQMNPTDREVFARAYAANLQQKAASVADRSDVASQFSNDALRGKMTAALNTPSDPLRAEKMEAFIHRENMMNMLKNKVLGYSGAPQETIGAGHAGHNFVGTLAGQFGAPGAGAITGGVGGWEVSPEGSTFLEKARNAGAGALVGGMLGLAGQGRASANEATMRIIGQQLASNSPAVYQRALNQVARTPSLLNALRSLSAAASGQAGAAYGAQGQ